MMYRCRQCGVLFDAPMWTPGGDGGEKPVCPICGSEKYEEEEKTDDQE